MTEFKVGDKVQAFKSTNGEITYGPVSSTFGSYTVYVVRKENGEEVTHRVSDLTAAPVAPVFAVGGTITLTTRPGSRATVEYGPFDSANTRGADVYVVKLVDPPADDSPRTFTALASVMEKVTPGDGFEYQGTIYEYGVTYEDRDGDRWKFDRPGTGGMPLSDDTSCWIREPLSDVVRAWGPLTAQ
ncbi:phiSA1p31-related protein [Streptomyces sp. ITFR-6]|uniref:phiSA1p31-related protein n=1 Tax=Streptomyces sp. ITFR-6 TaxID=3075197 RepID=UPI0028892AE8|nr:phiSA1p31-related protein [Streptomyces sp. ITFR-6]WNI28624.1 phiSA1p31-related protein [Streptomyces sp. ITFR-6]